MPRYTLHGLILEIEHRDERLDALLIDLSCVPIESGAKPPSLCIGKPPDAHPMEMHPGAREVFRDQGLVGLQAEGQHPEW